MSNIEAPRVVETDSEIETLLAQCAQLMEMGPAVAHLMAYGTEEEKRKFERAVEQLAELTSSFRRSEAFEYGID